MKRTPAIDPNKKQISLRAPAKINLCLHVLKRRADGYHELAMLMQAVSLYDELDLCLAPGRGVEVVCEELKLNVGEENLVAKAARQFLSACDIQQRVDIRLKKTIPIAAGLGGGSSDAASVLNGLNQLFNRPLSRAQLLTLAVSLGADVPFFIDQKPAWATGIGEILTPAPDLPAMSFVLVYPNIAVSTPWVYQNLALTSFSDTATFPEFFSSSKEVVRLLHNTLESVTIPAVPEVQQIKDQLLQLGALGTLMAGSGPTVFGVFGQRQAAEKAAERFKRKPDWRVFVVDPLPTGSATG